ncbi:MAG: carboxypeptidase regulatory-like domain-containing protein, partial [Zetaproteobacteria bacterium]
AGVGISPQISATGWAAIANWASGTRVIDDLGGVTTLPAARLAASYPIGDTPFRWSATDGAGQTTTVQSTLHVYAPATNVTLKVTDTAGNPLPNVRIAALARSSYAVVSLVDQNGNNRTDAAGQLLPAALDPGESYLLSFVSGDRYADGLLAGGNVVSSYQGAQAVTPASNGVVTAAMEGGAGRIAGQVVDGGGAAIPYARVDVAPLPYSELGAHLVTVADSQGDFSASVPPGDYYVMAAGSTIDPAIAAEQPLASMLAGGFYTADYAPVSPYSSAAGRVTVTAGTTRAVYMQLATGGLIAGRVTTTAGTPAVNMRVNLEPYGVAGAHRFTAVTDLNGVFQRNLPPGEYRIAATGVVFDPVSHSEQGIAGGWVGGYLSDGSGTLSWNTSAALIHPLAAGGQRVVTLTLTPGGTIRGQVTPAVAARVRIFARDGAGTITQRVFADAAGNYAINMPAGTVRLVVDSYAMDARTGQLTPLIGVVGGWVDANGIAQPLQAGAQAIALSAGQTVTRNIQLNAGTPFDAAAVVGAYIP